MSLQSINSFGYNIPRIVANTLLGVPDDTFAVPASLQTIPFFAIKNGDLWRWNTVTFIWEQVTSGGAGNTIYSADDNLAGNRNVGLNGKILTFKEGLNTFLRVDPTVNGENAFIGTYNATAGSNQSYLSLTDSDTTSGFILQSDFNAGTDVANIVGSAATGLATLVYNAPQGHTFSGGITLSNLAGSGSGIVAVDNAGSLSFTAIPAAGANTALSNLAAVAINTSLVSDTDNTDDLGSAAVAWKDGYFRRLLLDGATSGTPTILSDALGNVITGTVLSGTGTIPVEYDILVRADETLVNTNADQPLFTNAAHDLITILANTTYDFEFYFDLTHGAISHDLQFGMIPTTATITNIAYYSILSSVAVGTPTTSQYATSVKATATTPINLAAANAVESVRLKGWFTVGATGGTIQPTIQFSVDPTGTILLKAGARAKIVPRGNNTFTEKGPIG